MNTCPECGVVFEAWKGHRCEDKKTSGKKAYDGNTLMVNLLYDINKRIADGYSWYDVYNILKAKLKRIEIYENGTFTCVRWNDGDKNGHEKTFD